MIPESRYVFDTNTIVSALLFENSVPARALKQALKEGKLVVSDPVFAELREVLGRKKFDKYITHDERDRFLVALLGEAILIDITEKIMACRDPNDDKLLELAVSAGASALVTGDNDLLALHPFRGVDILTPAKFLKSRTPSE